MKIYLIGMPGSGKTTLGKKLAQELNAEFVDLDHIIEEREQRSVTEIFREKGEDHFRMVESQLLGEWASSAKAFVMATGGGAPCFFNGIDVINRSGVSIFLNVPLSVLVEQTSNRSTRPLLQHDDEDELHAKLSAIIEKRLPVYRKARITVHSSELKEALAALHLIK